MLTLDDLLDTDRRRQGNADIVKEEEAILKEALKTAESQKLNDMHSRGASSRLDDLVSFRGYFCGYYSALPRIKQ